MADSIATPDCVDVKPSVRIVWKDLVSPALAIIISSAVIGLFTLLITLSNGLASTNQRIEDMSSKMISDDNKLYSRLDKIDNRFDKLDSKIDVIIGNQKK